MNFYKHKKRLTGIVAIAMAIALNLSYLSFYASADSSDTTVEIFDIEAPVVGSYPDYEGSITGDYYEFLVEDIGYSVNGISWYNLTDDTNIDEFTCFESDKIYKVTVLVVPKGNNAWVLENATINGISADVAEAGDCYIVSYTFGEYEYVDLDGMVDITNVAEPSAGNTPSYSVTVESEFFEVCKDSFGYVFDGVTWFDTTNRSNMDVTDVFLYDHIYEISILLKKCEGCEIPLTAVTVNGKEASFYEDEEYYVVSYSFVECADTVIKSVSLELLREPVGGAVPCYDVYPDNDKYTLNYDKNNNYYQYGVGWYDVTEGCNLILDEDKFIAGHVYQLELYLKPAEHYTFNLTSATVNSKNAEIWGSNQNVVLMITFEPCKEAEGVIRGNVWSTLDTQENEVDIKLYEATREELIQSITVYEDVYNDYYIDCVPPGEYILIVNKTDHMERMYYLSLDDGRTLSLDIYIAQRGDCTLDGEIDVLDYQKVVNVSLSNDNIVPYYTTADEEYECALCDYAEDGYIDALDCAAIAILSRESRSYERVEFTDIEKPVAGESPAYTVTLNSSDYEVCNEDYGYTYGGVSWYDLTDDTNLDRTDVFTQGHKYSVTIEVAPVDNGARNLKYAVFEGVLVKAHKSDDCYLVTFIFET